MRRQSQKNSTCSKAPLTAPLTAPHALPFCTACVFSATRLDCIVQKRPLPSSVSSTATNLQSASATVNIDTCLIQRLREPFAPLHYSRGTGSTSRECRRATSSVLLQGLPKAGGHRPGRAHCADSALSGRSPHTEPRRIAPWGIQLTLPLSRDTSTRLHRTHELNRSKP